MRFDLMKSNQTNIHKKDESIDANNYTEEDKINSIMLLTQKQFGKIIDYFDNLPKYEYEIAYTTSDNIERKIVLSGIDDFFTLASVI
jgi:hypothetical protein